MDDIPEDGAGIRREILNSHEPVRVIVEIEGREERFAIEEDRV